MSAIADQVRVLLESLGDTPDQVADTLRARGITGFPEDPTYCPIANLIKAEVPAAANQDLWTYDLGDEGYFVCMSYVQIFGESDELRPPMPVKKFIAAFDGLDEAYLDLRAPAAAPSGRGSDD